MIDSSRSDEPPFLNPDLQFRQPVQPVDRSIYQTSVLAFRGLVLGTVCVFPFRLLSDEAQRAGLARESSRAPSNARRAWSGSLAGAGNLWNVADVLLRGPRQVAVCVLPCSQLPVGFRAR